MKSKRINKKLALNKSTIASLDGSALNNVKGGGPIKTIITIVTVNYTICATDCNGMDCLAHA